MSRSGVDDDVGRYCGDGVRYIDECDVLFACAAGAIWVVVRDVTSVTFICIIAHVMPLFVDCVRRVRRYGACCALLRCVQQLLCIILPLCTCTHFDGGCDAPTVLLFCHRSMRLSLLRVAHDVRTCFHDVHFVNLFSSSLSLFLESPFRSSSFGSLRHRRVHCASAGDTILFSSF